MQLSRRSITKALLLAPAMLPNRTFARQNDSIQPLDTGDVIIKSISPDGSTLMGLADRDVIAFLNAETLEEVSRTEPVAEIKLLDELSIAWSPDSGKIAFSLDAWIRGRDSDIFVVETATGTITNLTGEGTEEEAPLLFGEESHGLLIDVYPYWMSNDTILFGRHQMTDEMITCVLTTLRLSSNEVDNWASLHDKGLPFVAGPLHRVGENSMAMWMTDDSSKPTVVVARATGELERINSADVPFPRLVDADEAFAYLISADGNGDVWRIPMDGGESQPLQEVLGLAQSAAVTTYPACGPEPGSFVLVADFARNGTQVLLFDGTESRSIAALDEFPASATCHWVEGRLLITNRGDSYLIDIAD
ncbi:MAG: hypothetical protein M9950_09550 [Thermomicrobiales bacterium]|nr:hypothetical protein [Thermomicrobiales bacterium]MCO5218257.1 hypothetical protein [Thermomicrobiales bacterium]